MRYAPLQTNAALLYRCYSIEMSTHAESNLPGATTYESTGDLVEMSPGIEDAARLGISMVMEEVTDDPSQPSLMFTRSLSLGSPHGPIPLDGFYDFREDRIYIALGTLRQNHPPTLVEPVTLLIAAHEARHRVQIQHFGATTAEAAHLGTANAYATNPHEEDAWQTAIRIFEKAYPHIPFSFSVADRIWQTSNYARPAGH